jgi:hypothetical protein
MMLKSLSLKRILAAEWLLASSHYAALVAMRRGQSAVVKNLCI